jgi:pimeloyl-ACP methyl ester carboxylesterase
MSKAVYFEEYLDTGAPQYLLHFPSAGRETDTAAGRRAGQAAGPAPVLLFVHGGPGFSESFMGYRLKKQWGDLATLVFWDQRGCGKSLAASPRPAPPVPYSITIDDVKRDMKAVVDHLKQRYDRQRIIIMGHSWGSILCTLYALEHPDDLLLYIGTGVCVQLEENERRVWETLRARITQAGNEKDLAALPPFENIELMGPPGEPLPPEFRTFMRLRLKYRLASRLWLAVLATFLLNPTFSFSDFSFRRKDVDRLRTDLVDYLREFDLRQYGPRYQVPIAYLQGADDWGTVTSMATEYFETIDAPRKLLRLIPGAGHNAMGDAPAEFAAAMREALKLIE